jgi:cell division protein ZipA
VVHVMAKDKLLKGAELLDTVLQCGMRYGSMDIFHRYASAKGEGAHLFSMANMVKPGTFDLDAMEQFETPGVSFFMTLPIDADSMQSFDLMIDTARTVAGTLGGELKDDQRSVMTKQTLEHCRERIRDYERQRLFRRPK